MDLQTIKALDQQYYMNTFGQRLPLAFTGGQGMTLYATDGKKYIDFLSGIAVNALGYNHSEFNRRMHQQLDALLHCSNHFYIESQAVLAQLLVENTCFDKAFFANTGAEANEGAIKLVRKYHKEKNTGRYEIISANNSFHGRTLATIAATGQEKYQKPFTPLPAGFVQVDYNDLDALKAAVNEHTAGILMEVIQGEGGVIEASPEYIQAVAALCKENGILLVIDEVQTGMGRTGKLMAHEYFGIEPDIITLAKALGNGIPIGAVLAKDEVCAFCPGDHGTTFGGNPFACAAGVAVMEIFKQENILANVIEMGNYFKAQLNALKEKYDFITDVRGKGLILGMELDSSVTGKTLVTKMLEKGFIINCAGHNTLRFLPPLIVTKEDIDLLLSNLEECLSDLKG